MAIDIGPGATDRASYAPVNYTSLDFNNPANATGIINVFEVWFFASDATGVKIGTFSGSGTSYTNRDYETLGTVASGSKQTFSGLNCDVATGDYIGCYWATGSLERDETGGSSAYKAGDQFGTGTQTYAAGARIYSLYGTGTEAGGGWTHIAKVSGVTASAIVKMDGVTIAAIAKVSGTAV